jgi:ABC-type dipeptide/oligopeptide/nickel transport system permease subunit
MNAARVEATLPPVAEPAPESPLLGSLKQFLENRLAAASILIVLAFGLLAIFAPWIAPHDPYEADLFLRLQPPAWIEGGEWAYPLGCDALGRDILSRLIFGARVSMFIGLAVIVIATGVGIIAGLASGYLRGWVDVTISRVVDILLGFPYLIFAIGLMAMMGPGLQNIILALVYKEWVVPCRVVRGETLAAREVEYVEAARALGASRLRIMFREILPNILSPVIVVATIRMAQVIILEASLSFLGLGVQPPTASWGSMVADGRDFLLDAWWVSTFPGLTILVLVLAINVASQGLRDAFDPRFKE